MAFFLGFIFYLQKTTKHVKKFISIQIDAFISTELTLKGKTDGMILCGLTLVSSLKLELFVFLGSGASVLWLAFSLLLLQRGSK